MEKIKTGVNGLDKLLDGGFPHKTVILVSGDPGSGKTLLGLNFVIQGAKSGERCCYVSFSETEEELIRACKEIDSMKDVEKYFGANLVFKHIELNENTGLDDFTKAFSLYPDIDKLVIDNVNKLFLHARNSKDYRFKLVELAKYLKAKTKCTLILCESKKNEIDSGNNEAFECDGIVRLSFLDLEEKPMRTIEIHKLRYSSTEPRIPYEFVISRDNITLGKTKII